MAAVSGLDRARHELGHHFVGYHLKFEMGEVSIEPPLGNLVFIGGTSELDTSRPITSMPDLEKWCEDRVKVLYAGVMAQALKSGVVDNQAAIDLTQGVSGNVDYKMVSQLLNLLRNIRYNDRPPADAESAMQADENKLWKDTSDLVTSYAPEIEGVAIDLLKTLKLTRQQFEMHPLVKARFP
ncbi:hypothetical protein [Mesorhizobium sp. M0244]|uniref:hypothetical protein n=1 Tax=Mesorhizobium sp. M0244 TaxID=2956926 RepID=UPI00333B4A02